MRSDYHLEKLSSWWVWGTIVNIIEEHGWTTPFVMARCLWWFLAARVLRSADFSFGGKNFRYCSQIPNKAFANERTVEVPIALGLFPLSGRILEIGNVLGQYHAFKHIVVDKYEQSEDIINTDIIDYSPSEKYDLILSVSTFEHIGFDESIKDSLKVDRAVDKAKQLLAPGGRFLMTIPIAWNPDLDKKLASLGFTALMFMKRTDSNNEWRETTSEDALWRQYGKPYICANAIAVCIYENKVPAAIAN